MTSGVEESRIHPAWWTVILIVGVVMLVVLTSLCYVGAFSSYVTVLLKSDRSGLMMESGGKVKMLGIQVGQVASVVGKDGNAQIALELFPDQIQHIPANVGAQIRATTAFGAKYVELIYPDDPSTKRIAAGMVLLSRNVSTEVQTVFQNLVNVFDKIDPPKLNAVLAAVAQGVRGRGPALGQAISDTNAVLTSLNSRGDALRQNWVSLAGAAHSYDAAAKSIVAILDASAVSSETITRQAGDLQSVLLNTIGLADSGTTLLGPSQDHFIRGINTFESTAALLGEYSPVYTCFLQGANHLTETAPDIIGADGRSVVLDASLGFSTDPYRYPDNLAFVGAKGGPGGRPSCGSLPVVKDDWPQRYLVTDTGFGTGLDKRPNPGIAHPWWVNFLPVTRAIPQPPSVRGDGPPAIGPVPYPGAPPYGAPMYGPGGVPLYPGVPPVPPPTQGPPDDPIPLAPPP